MASDCIAGPTRRVMIAHPWLRVASSVLAGFASSRGSTSSPSISTGTRAWPVSSSISGALARAGRGRARSGARRSSLRSRRATAPQGQRKLVGRRAAVEDHARVRRALAHRPQPPRTRQRACAASSRSGIGPPRLAADAVAERAQLPVDGVLERLLVRARRRSRARASPWRVRYVHHSAAERASSTEAGSGSPSALRDLAPTRPPAQPGSLHRRRRDARRSATRSAKSRCRVKLRPPRM